MEKVTLLNSTGTRPVEAIKPLVASVDSSKLAELHGKKSEVEAARPKIVDLKLDNAQQISQYKETKATLDQVISDLHARLADGGRGLSFSVDEQAGRFVLQVKKSETGEVIRQIPSEVVVRMAHSIEELKGILFNEAT
jgi:flagellar protein FlaG